ncbi:Collagen adhesin precursor [Paenibacillus konkukensis]|uniref:Collagen adhesin n=1 Tax=Paenibacillus konkukensis TaxID=2020716 RepID=A0ABY4RN41_9BACL|nr:collagen binding domain-containing protein [Paenibacillus konkukensis]UQZ82978.1 Collagen adhesin precursor [Paenibacillus konkukensis]
MAKKKISTLLIGLLMILQVLSAFGFSPQANAAAITDNIIDSVSMAVYDKSGHVVTENVYEPGSKVQLDYTWSLPGGHDYKNGDTFTFKLPDEFKFYNDIPAQPLISSGEAIGKFTLNKDSHEVVMTMESIENLSDVRGTLTFQTVFDMDVIQGSTTQIIKIPVHGGEQVFTLRFKPNVDSTIGKSGVPDGYNAKQIDWTVDVNKELAAVQNAVVTDPIPAGLGAPVTVAVYELGVNLDGTVVQGAPVDGSRYIVNTAGNVLTLSFTDNPIRTAYRIQYTTPVTDGDKTSFVNKATLQGGNQTPVSATATVTVQRGTALDKVSTKYDADTQTIDWEIKYNYNEKTIAQTEAFLADLFNDSQELVAGSLHVYPVTVDAKGAETLGAELPAAEYSVTPETAAGSTGFKLQFAHPISSAYKIKYQTKAVHRVIDNAVITNKVVSGSGGSKTATRGINQVVIAKGVGLVDYKAKTAAWSITINRDSETMSGVVVTDKFLHQGLRFIPEAFTVYEGGQRMSPSDYTVDPAIAPDQGFAVTFHRTINSPVTIYYNTEFNMDWLSAGAVNFLNEAVVDWIDSASNAQTKTVTATFDPRNEAKNNGLKSGVYDASSKQIAWTVGVNYNGKTLAEAVVEDTLESGQKLVADSLAVYGMNIASNGNPSLGSVVDSTYYNYSVDENNKLTVTFQKPISAPYYVVFKTSLDGKIIDNKVSNTAGLLDGVTPVSNPLTASVSIPNGGEYVNKNGKQNGDKIDWTVLINRTQSTVTDAKIIDTPSDNQLLLPGTFKLFTTKVDANGTVNKAAELVKDKDYKLEIKTDDDGKQSFELSFLKKLATAAILEYQSLIVAKDQDTVSNKIAFSGNNEITVTKDTSTSVVVGVTSGSGTISGIRGTLTVTKVDGAAPAVKLAGATFELYRKTGSEQLLVGTLTTGTNGEAVFKKLLAGDYVLKETAAPAGYALDSREYPVKIQTADGYQLTIANDKIVKPNPPDTDGKLTVKKVDSEQSGLLLAGATFELYAKTGTGLTPAGVKTTDASGIIVFDKLAPGEYVVKETAAPAGYVLDSKEHPVTVQTAADVQLTVTNDKDVTPNPPTNPASDGWIAVKKVDSEQPDLLLGGATFELYAKTESGLASMGAKTTDASGTIVFDKLAAGEYVVKETTAPAGYVLDAKEYPVTLQTSGSVQFTVMNNKDVTSNPPTTPVAESSITVKKTDSVRSDLLLSGAVFELYAKTGTGLTPVGAKTTDANGMIVFDKLTAGEYVVKETAAPAGYVLDAKEYPVTLQTSDNYSLTVTNLRIRKSSSSSSSSSPTPSTPTPTPAEENPANPNPSQPGSTIDGDVKVPLGGPSVTGQPDSGEETVQPDNPANSDKPDNSDGSDTNGTIEVNQKVPLGNPPEDGKPKETLPKTGEASPVFIEIAGLILILVGLVLRRKLTKNI